MAVSNTVAGQEYRPYRSDGVTAGPARFKFFCPAVTLKIKRSTTFEDVTVNDCDIPNAVAVERSVQRTRNFSAEMAGALDALKCQVLEADYERSGSWEWQFLLDKTAVLGGQTYTGFFFVQEMEFGKENGGIVKFTCQLKGDGIITRAPVV
jgi:hypothetical protein